MFVCHFENKKGHKNEKLFFYQDDFNGPTSVFKGEWQIPRSESLKWHLTSGICSEDNNGVRYHVRKKDSTMSEEVDA